MHNFLQRIPKSIIPHLYLSLNAIKYNQYTFIFQNINDALQVLLTPYRIYTVLLLIFSDYIHLLLNQLRPLPSNLVLYHLI